MSRPTVFETRQAADDRWATLKTLVSEVADAADAALLIETHALNEPSYRGLEHREAVARLLADAPILEAVYERGREMLLQQMAEEQAEERERLAQVLNPDDDAQRMEKKMAQWIPGKVEAEARAFELYRRSSYTNREQMGRERRLEKAADDFDAALLDAAGVVAERGGVDVTKAAQEILGASRALQIAKVAAGRGARVPGAISILHRCYKVAVQAPEGSALRAAVQVAQRYDGPPPAE